MKQQQKKALYILNLNNMTIKDVDGNEITTKNDNEEVVAIVLDVKKDVANHVYRSIGDVDFIHPLQELSRNGECELSAEQLDVFEQIMSSSNFTLPVKCAILDRIKEAKQKPEKKGCVKDV